MSTPRARIDAVGSGSARRLHARERRRLAHGDARRADLLAQTIRADDVHVARLRIEALQIMRGRVRARDDVLGVATETESPETLDVFRPRRGRIVRREEDLPARLPQTLARVPPVGQAGAAPVEDAVHVEDRDRPPASSPSQRASRARRPPATRRAGTPPPPE